MRLSEMREGQSGRIVSVGGDMRLRRRILEMGLTRDSKFYIEKYAPLRDPLELTTRGMHVSLRVKEAMAITVEPLETDHG
ncbi:FeoA family protein [Desulfosalsimonas propionicica]|nr:FeoA family protein [Desulfosalsimonas propionicica]